MEAGIYIYSWMKNNQKCEIQYFRPKRFPIEHKTTSFFFYHDINDIAVILFIMSFIVKLFIPFQRNITKEIQIFTRFVKLKTDIAVILFL